MPKHIGFIIHVVHTCLELIQNDGLLADDVLRLSPHDTVELILVVH